MPTADEVTAAGGAPALNLDLHVYSTKPAERLVFVNAHKYREGDTLQEGPIVRQITPDGAILEFRGSKFLLSKD
jgi:general secretion pathway protein B